MDPRYLPLIPGGQYGQDMGDQVAGAYKRGGVGAATGAALRTATAIPLAVGADVLRPAMPAWDAAAQGLKTFVTGDPTPISGVPTLAAPAKTRNAVAVTNNMNKGSADSQTDRAPGKAQVPGQSQAPNPNAQGALSPGGLPYFTTPTSEKGIERIDTKGGSPLFTNMGGAGLDDISKKGAVLPSVAGFLQGVPTFGQGAGAVQRGDSGTMFAGDGGGGGGPSGINAALLAKISEYEDAAKPLINSRGIVDRLRGRTLLKARGRLVGDITALQNSDIGYQNAAANMQHAGASTAMVGVAQQRVNQEAQQNAASNTLRGREIDVTGRGQELAFLPKLEDAVRGRRYQDAAGRGDAKEMQRISTESRFPPLQHNPSVTVTPAGDKVIVVGADGMPRVHSMADLDENNKKAKEALAPTAAAR